MSTTQTFIQPIVVTALNHAFLPLGQRSGKRVLAASMFLCSMCFTAFYFAKVFLRLKPSVSIITIPSNSSDLLITGSWFDEDLVEAVEPLSE